MKKVLIILLFLLVSATPGFGGEHHSGEDYHSTEEPIDILLTLSEYRFIPDELELESGKLYRLTIYNEGKLKHELDAPELSSHVFTKKIVVFDDSGNMIAEIKGKPREVELAPGKRIEWWFVPFVSSEEEGEMVCDLPGHLAFGMKGTVLIKK